MILLDQPFFKYFLLPILFVLLFVISRLLLRPAGLIRKQDLAVGPDLIVTAFFVVVISVISKTIQAEQLGPQFGAKALLRIEEDVWVLLALVYALFATLLFIRTFGWDSQRNLRVLPGVTFPLAIGMLALTVAISRTL